MIGWLAIQIAVGAVGAIAIREAVVIAIYSCMDLRRRDRWNRYQLQLDGEQLAAWRDYAREVEREVGPAKGMPPASWFVDRDRLCSGSGEAYAICGWHRGMQFSEALALAVAIHGAREKSIVRANSC